MLIQKNYLRLYSFFFCLFVITASCKRKCPVCETDPLPVHKTIYIFQQKIHVADAYITSLNTDLNYGNKTSILSAAWTQDGTELDTYALLKFDYSSLPDTATVKSATLTLYADTTIFYSSSKGHYGNNENPSVIKNISGAWNETTVSWNNRPAVTIANQVLIPATYTSSDSVYVNVTGLVNDQRLNGNFGFQFEIQKFLPYQRLVFYSSEMTAYPKLIPKLVIVIE